MKDRYIICICFLLILIGFFYFFRPFFIGPDQPIYYAYTESVVEDGDLNPVNNIHFNFNYYFPKGVKEVTQTYNLPDFHNHGGVILWAPVYLLGKHLHNWLEHLNTSYIKKYSEQAFIQCLLSFSTVASGFLTLLLTYLLCSLYFPRWISFLSTIIVCFATPYFYYVIHEPGNAQIITCLFSVISIFVISSVIRDKKSHWFTYGLFFSICLVLKSDIWAQIFFIAILFGVLIKFKQSRWINAVFFILGTCPALAFKCINDYLKYGTFHMGEIEVLNTKMSYLVDMLFSPYRGYIYTSPVFYICLIGIILVSITFIKNIKKINTIKSTNDLFWKDAFIFLLSSYLIIKVLIISRNYAWGGGTAGARALLTEFPVFVLLFARVLNIQSKIFQTALIILSLFFIGWNILIISEYMLKTDLSYIKEMPIMAERLKNFRSAFSHIFVIKGINLKSLLCLIPALLLTIITLNLTFFTPKTSPSFWYLHQETDENIFYIFCVSAIILNIVYGVISFSNMIHNQKNVLALQKSGFFDNAVILPKKEFEKNENIGAMKEMLRYYTYKGNKKRVEKVKNYLKDLSGVTEFPEP